MTAGIISPGSAKAHWERVYSTKASDAVSWYQAHARVSLEMIHATGIPRDASIIDVGGGASLLVDELLDEGYSRLAVLDLSGAALATARQRLGVRAARVRLIEADITDAASMELDVDVWHDRAVFHFLVTDQAREAYLGALARALRPGGQAIIATFAEDGPEKCSGLSVVRYSASELHARFGGGFELAQQQRELHLTPFGTTQTFTWCRFVRR